MAKSNAQRQAEYRRRHLKDVDASCERLNLLVSIQTKRQLERLAFCFGLTQRTMLEQILAGVERATVDRLPADAQSDYYERQKPLLA